ncbi:MAG: diaminopimelate epimerase [Anaeromicrobium sp.]|jgi:diaminopimelate epimerase|uniref:diaminopimelate epimerase n=1 Tax=Anaeromicrobium sp. TaxID=1929132 RepID=UPI0025EF8DE9|nr:diaminopimelate epimerase [Anaeromicrobium sp.]MCT4595674.1 diaminopimelate epimerase [Anaeromicrobium sp.]
MKFTKMHGAGNDFVLFNGLKENIDDYGKLALQVCHRHFSVGGDGIMVVEESNVADVKMIYFNSDGSQGEMCGNGIRCFSKFVYDNNIVNKEVFTVETLAGIQNIWLEVENKEVKFVKVKMSKPLFDPKDIPVMCEGEKVIEKCVEIDGKEVVFSTIFLGVPHTVVFVDDIKDIDINGLGSKMEIHPIFPKKTNVNFVEVKDRNHINVYTWERGAGRTLACGTGCCSSVVLGNVLNKLNQKVKVQAEGGAMEIEIKDDFDVFMKGEATTICVGEFMNF